MERGRLAPHQCRSQKDRHLNLREEDAVSGYETISPEIIIFLQGGVGIWTLQDPEEPWKKGLWECKRSYWVVAGSFCQVEL